MRKLGNKKILVIGLMILFLGAGATINVGANQAFYENFDSYTDGKVLDGVGGWIGWNDVAAAAGVVSTAYARSSPNSMKCEIGCDAVHEFAGYTSGAWTWTAYQYVPADFVGDTYMILCSGYDGGGSGTEWVVQVHIDAEQGYIISDWAGEFGEPIYGQWVQYRCEIDLDDDWLQIFYNNELLAEHAYSDTVQGSGGGTLAIAAVDLFANGASAVYWDDISLVPAGGGFTVSAGGPYTTELGKTTQFNGMASGGKTPYTYAWTFGDGGTATTINPTHDYAALGVYDVTFKVTDADHITLSDTTTVTVIPPQPALQIASISGGFGVKAVVKNTGDGAATNVDVAFELDGGAFIGASSTATIPTIAAKAEATAKAGFIFGIGKTTITVTATCDEGKTATLSKTATVLGPFVIGIA